MRDMERQASTVDTNAGSHLIVTIHGIRTFGSWQERFEHLALAELGNPSIEFVHYKLGYFSIFAFIVPFFRWLVVRRFRNDLIQLCTRTPRARIDLVGHSFGTHVIGWAIANLPKGNTIKINNVILAGSVLKDNFPWRDLIGTTITRVVNDCGLKDHVLLLSRFCVLFTGMAGRTGFSGATSSVFEIVIRR